MKPHAAAVDGNLVTSADDGSVWAVWRVEPVPYRYSGDNDRFAHAGAVARLLRGLQRPAMLFSACQPITPTLLERWLRTGAVPSRRLDARVDETVDAFINEPGRTLYERTYWLTAQVQGGRGDRLSQQATRFAHGAWRQAWSYFLEPLGREPDERTTHLAVEASEMERQLGLELIVRGLGKPYQPRPGGLLAIRATVGDVEWLTARLSRRGTGEDVSVDEWDSDERRATRGGMMQLNDAGWAENWVDGVARTAKLRNHVAACLPDSDAVSYQASFVVGGAPSNVFFPGSYSEWLVRAMEVVSPDEGVFPVDWCLHVTPRRDARARKQVGSKLTNAAEQPDHTDEGTGTGTAEHVLTDIDALRELVDRTSAGEVRLDTVLWFTVAADSYERLQERMRSFRALWSQPTWRMTRPYGKQLGLARASQPGASLPDDVSDFKRVQLPDLVAAGAPFAGAEVGDPYGALVAMNLGDGLAGPVLWDPGYGIREQNRSGSAFFVGVTGAGKSTAAKTLMEALMVRGSRFVAVDPVGEYVPLCRHVGGQLVDPYHPEHSLDPLMSYAALVDPTPEARDRAAEAAIGIISALSKRGIEPLSAQWARLRQLVEYALDERLRFVEVLGWVVKDDTGVFDGMAEPLRVAATLPRLSAIFDPHLLSLNARHSLTVIVLRGLRLPRGEKGDASSEELQGLALMTAAVHAAREAVYMDAGRYGAVVLDEARALLATPYGYDMVYDLLDQGRKWHAGAWVSVTDVDAVPEKLYDQADTRFVFRLESDRAISRARKLLGSAGDDPDIGSILTQLHNGECVFRDVRHRVGRVYVFLPLNPELNATVRTTPTLDVTPDEELAPT